MKIKNTITLLLLIASIQVMAQGNDAMKRMENGLQYKIYTANAGPKIKLNDIVTFNFLQKTGTDSVLVNSFEVNKPATIQIQAPKNIADLMGFFPLLSVNDSALVLIPTDSIFVSPEMQRPPFLPKGSSLKILVKIIKIQSMEEAMADQQRVMAEFKSTEAATLAKYLADNKAPTIKTASGLRYRITKASTKPKPVTGDTVFVNYVGKTLAGKVFDSSIEAEAKKANLQQQGRIYEPIPVVIGQRSVIPGWEEGLKLINEGSKAVFVIPSDLAYGAQGASEDIKPFTPLMFEIEIVKVKRPKAVAAKKAVASKPAAKKPVTKPAAKKPVAKTPAKKT